MRDDGGGAGSKELTPVNQAGLALCVSRSLRPANAGSGGPLWPADANHTIDGALCFFVSFVPRS